MTKNKKIIIGILLLAGILISSIYFINNNKEINKMNEIDYEYGILDESVLNTDILKKWVEENSLSKGFYTTSDSEYTYVLISYGETDKPGIGICLEDVKSVKNNSVKIEYSIISNNQNEEDKVENYTPKMILRFDNKDLKVTSEEVNPS